MGEYGLVHEGTSSELIQSISTIFGELAKGIGLLAVNPSNMDILQNIEDNAKMLATQTQEAIKMKRKDKYLEGHHYWKGRNDNKWYTYLPDETRGRKLVKRNEKADIEAVIIDHYKKIEAENLKTFRSVYHEWRSYQDKMVVANSIVKYESDEKKFFVGEYFDKNISTYSEDDIKVQIRELIESLKLCKSACKRMMGYMNNTFMFAERHDYIAKNPMASVKLKHFTGYCYDSKRSQKPQTIDPDDLKKLRDVFEDDYVNQPKYIPTYAVELASLTGMRVGELSALRWDSIFDDYFVVDKSEKYDRKKKEYYISKTKNKKTRMFPITDEIRKLFIRLKKVEIENGYICEWVFANESGRIHAPVISSCLKNKCRMLGITERGIHSYRKTLNSYMRANGVSSVMAAALIGNSVDVNNEFYTFDVTPMDEKNKIVSEVNLKMKVI